MLEVAIRKKLDHFVLESSFTLNEGCLGILGASGCGKSATLKCIAGILTPDEGIIRLNGRTLFDSERNVNLKPQERGIGYLFQNYALFPNMTVFENITAGYRTADKVHTRQERENSKEQCTKKAVELMELFSLTELRNCYPQTLSGGEQQRTALARLLMSKPEVLLLDEPFSALDTYLKESLQQELIRLMQKFEMPAVLVSHSRDEVYRLSKQIVIMQEGKIAPARSTKELFLDPVTIMAARLTGCKNIASAEYTKAGLFVPKWDMTFELPEKAAVTAVGIRAHDFMTEPSFDVENTCISIPVCIKEISEGPFEWNVMFQKKGCAEANDKPLWWKVSKELKKTRAEIEKVTILYIKKEKVLYLS